MTDDNLTDGAMYPASAVRQLLQKTRTENVTVAANRELTLQMWEDIGTRYITPGLARHPYDEEDQCETREGQTGRRDGETDDRGRTSLAAEA